eukprot:s2822_g8.t1
MACGVRGQSRLAPRWHALRYGWLPTTPSTCTAQQIQQACHRGCSDLGHEMRMDQFPVLWSADGALEELSNRWYFRHLCCEERRMSLPQPLRPAEGEPDDSEAAHGKRISERTFQALKCRMQAVRLVLASRRMPSRQGLRVLPPLWCWRAQGQEESMGLNASKCVPVLSWLLAVLIWQFGVKYLRLVKSRRPGVQLCGGPSM